MSQTTSATMYFEKEGKRFVLFKTRTSWGTPMTNIYIDRAVFDKGVPSEVQVTVDWVEPEALKRG